MRIWVVEWMHGDEWKPAGLYRTRGAARNNARLRRETQYPYVERYRIRCYVRIDDVR